MENFGEAISEILSKLAEWLGLKPSQAKRLDLMEEKLSQAKRDNCDRLDDVKREIKALEARALQKKKEIEQTRGDSQRIIAGEIERTFRELDRLQDRARIIESSIDRIAISLAKIRELKVALAQGVSEEQLDEIALELHGVFADLKATDKAARELEREKYEAPQAAQVDADRRMAELEGTQESPTGLRPETMKRLKQLEAEEA